MTNPTKPGDTMTDTNAAQELAALRATVEQQQREIEAIKQTLRNRRGSI